MADRLTPAELLEIEGRAERAQCGPWRVGNVEKWHVYCPSTHADAAGFERVLLRMNEHFEHAADADFIAHSRTDVPRLLAEVRALQEEVARLREACVRGVGGELTQCMICRAGGWRVEPFQHAADCAAKGGDHG